MSETSSAPSRLVRPLAWSLVGGAFALRLPAFAEPLGIDQGIFATAGWGLSHGLRLYQDLWDQKPPGIHLTYWAVFRLFGAHAGAVVALDIAAAALTTAGIFFIVRALWGRSLGLMAAVLFAIGSLPAARFRLGGFLERAVPEVFITALVTVAVWSAVTAVRDGRSRAWRLAASGAAIGAAVVYKPNAAIYLSPILIWIAFSPPRHLVRDVLALGSGMLLTIGLAIAWLWSQGILRDTWVAVVQFNVAYVSGGKSTWDVIDRLAHEVWLRMKTDPVWMLGTSGFVVSLARWRFRGVPSTGWLVASAWLAAAIIAAGANGIRMYSNYFIGALPPLVLLSLSWLQLPRRRRWFLAIPAAVAIVLCARAHYVENVWTMTMADAGQLAGRGEAKAEYLSRFGGYDNGRGYSARANDELVAYIRQRTAPADRIYIFGMAPGIYVESKRLPANRFLWTDPAVSRLIASPGFTLEELVADLEAARPLLLVLERNNRNSLTGWRIEDEYAKPVLQSLLSRYQLEVVIEDFSVYRLRS